MKTACRTLADTGSIPVTSTMNEDTIGFTTHETAMGTLTVYTKDQPGPNGHKAGTTKMVYLDPPPRPMKLKRKYLSG